MTAAYDHDGFWLKAKLFLNRATDDDGARSFDERAMWASMSLELLAKAALSRVSPLLIAEPNEEGTNLLAASGLTEAEARFISVRAKTVYVRCARAFKPFSSADALRITQARNEYVHGTGTGYGGIPAHAWWPRFWAQAAILIEAQDKSLRDLLGDRSDTAERHLDQNAKNVEHRTLSLISRAKQRVLERATGNVPARVARASRGPFDLLADLAYSGSASCPACGEQGTLEADESEVVGRETVQVGEHEWEQYVTRRAFPDYFSCANCELVLDRIELLEEAGLPDEFEFEGEEDYEEPEYGND
jgi:hypothetical protein